MPISIKKIEKTDEKTPPSCEFCGSSKVTYLFDCQDLDYFLPGTFRLFECPTCGVVFQHPKPTKAQIKDFYPAEYVSFNRGKNAPVAWITNFFALSDLRSIKRNFPGREKISILDVGCGDGSTLLFYKKHIPSLDLYGFELDSAKRDLVDPSVHCKFGSLDEFGPESFDIVRMSQMMEHDPDPVGTLAKVYGWLKPGGYLLGETPNYQCVDFKLFKSYWGCLDMPRHLFLFSEDFMRRQLGNIGFKEVEIRYTLRTVGIANGLLYWLKYSLLKQAFSQKPHQGITLSELLMKFLALPVVWGQCLWGRSAGMKFEGRKPLSTQGD